MEITLYSIWDKKLQVESNKKKGFKVSLKIVSLYPILIKVI